MRNTLLKYEHNDLNDLDFFASHYVRKAPLYVLDEEVDQQTARPLGNAFALQNRNGDIVSDKAVTGTYSLENHVDLYTKHNKLLADSDLPTSNIAVIDEVTPDGLKARRSIKFLDTGREVKNNTGTHDVIHCRTDVVNSVNQSWAFQMFGGAYRDYCENSMVFGGDKVAYQKQKHTRHFNPHSILSTANSALSEYERNVEAFNAWKDVKVTDKMAMEFLAEAMCKYSDKEIEKKAMELVGADADDPYIKYNKKKLASLLVIWNDYSRYESLGKNKWALYNTLTHFATHTHETYNIVAQDKQGIDYDTEHCTGRIGKNTNALQASNRGKNYTLNEQHERSKNIAFVVTTPAWQGIGQVA